MRLLVLVLAMIASTAYADGFYVESGISYMQMLGDSGKDTVLMATPTNGSMRFEYIDIARWRRTDINEVRNPYGDISLGYDWQWRTITLDFQLKHQSSIAAGDHGQNQARLSLRWYPFH